MEKQLYEILKPVATKSGVMRSGEITIAHLLIGQDVGQLVKDKKLKPSFKIRADEDLKEVVKSLKSENKKLTSLNGELEKTVISLEKKLKKFQDEYNELLKAVGAPDAKQK